MPANYVKYVKFRGGYVEYADGQEGSGQLDQTMHTTFPCVGLWARQG
jgi:hypothetical protein